MSTSGDQVRIGGRKQSLRQSSFHFSSSLCFGAVRTCACHIANTIISKVQTRSEARQGWNIFGQQGAGVITMRGWALTSSLSMSSSLEGRSKSSGPSVSWTGSR